MKVTRDVIVDLWPLYEADAASPDSRALVEEFLMSDPELALGLKQGEESSRRLLAPQSLRPPDSEKAALERVKMLLRLRYYLLALAIATTGFAAMLRQYRPFTIFMALGSMAAWAALWLNVGAHDLQTGAPPQAPVRRAHFRMTLIVLALVALLFASMFRPPALRIGALVVSGSALLVWVVVALTEGRRRG